MRYFFFPFNMGKPVTTINLTANVKPKKKGNKVYAWPLEMSQEESIYQAVMKPNGYIKKTFLDVLFTAPVEVPVHNQHQLANL